MVNGNWGDSGLSSNAQALPLDVMWQHFVITTAEITELVTILILSES